jgi:hypothetical protein
VGSLTHSPIGLQCLLRDSFTFFTLHITLSLSDTVLHLNIPKVESRLDLENVDSRNLRSFDTQLLREHDSHSYSSLAMFKTLGVYHILPSPNQINVVRDFVR